MFKPKRILFFFSTFLLLIFIPFLFAEESVTITTYYPSPYGVYSSLQVDKLGVGDNSGDNILNSADVPTTSGDAWIKGKVGIGTMSPGVALDVNGAVRAGGSATVSVCGSGQTNGEGSQRYNYTTHFMEYCNGTGWVPLTSLGVGQTWQDFSATKNPGTTYTNNTGKPIFISAASGMHGGTGSATSITVDGLVVSACRVSVTYSNCNATAIIPPGSTYSVYVSYVYGQPETSGEYWYELR